LLKDPSLRKQLGEAAAKEVREKWLWSKVLKKFCLLIQSNLLFESCGIAGV